MVPIFEQYIVPAFSDKIIYDFPVNSIDYTTDQIVVKDIGGNSHMADRVIVTVPLNILKNEFISFVPSLPAAKTEALARTDMPDGLKVFMKFSERFYPDILLVGGLLEGSSQEKIYYNAAFKKDSSENVLALFNVGESASEYTDLGSNEAIIAAVLAELDEIFDGAASANYQSHIVQNWSAEPYIQGSYSQGGDHYQQTIKDISEPVSNKLFFAGDALHSESWSTVQGAGLSGSDTAKTILQSG
ncbi:MAG: FAD-dependent oxidoreductase [Bacteroidetes bacterium]|nr:FAD-dependent oxidoreductase [Bacteroidota bacterium]